MESVVYRDMGMVEYGLCWELQQSLFHALVATKKGETPLQAPQTTLILCEHPHVYTLGKSGHADNMLIGETFLKQIGASYYHIDRGGDITYHGPGQLVGYPILDLERLGMGLKGYIHALEQTVIDTVADYGIRAGRSEGAAGVWLPADDQGSLRKICAIGVRSSHFVTMHGFALNVNTQLEYFTHINPCGFTDRGVTSMQQELGRPLDMEEVKRCYLSHFEKIMNIKIKTEQLCQQQKDGCSSPKVIPRK